MNLENQKNKSIKENLNEEEKQINKKPRTIMTGMKVKTAMIKQKKNNQLKIHLKDSPWRKCAKDINKHLG